ncbi:MAG: PucR family transcriptional regulator, partial [Pseudonocardiaceae bacterium]
MSIAAGGQVLPASTLRRLARASGGLATASVAEMERRYPWFRRLSADQRAGVLLVTQASVANFVEWLTDPQRSIRLTIDAFRTAPRDLTHWVSLRQTVDLVRVAALVFEQQLPDLAADDAERAVLTEASLRYSREVAFAAASTYAGAAEARGAWDARLEALVVDGIMRGDGEESLLSRAAALGLEPTAPATVLVGNPPPDDPPELLADIRGVAVRTGRGVLVGVQGSRLVLVVSGSLDPPEDHQWMIEAFGEGPVVVGPTVPSLTEAHRSAADALSGLRAVAAWPSAPRPVPAAELLPERALAGDPEAERLLVQEVMRPLATASGGLV